MRQSLLISDLILHVRKLRCRDNLPKVKYPLSSINRILTQFGFWATKWYLMSCCLFTLMGLLISPRTHHWSEDLQPSVDDCKACLLSMSTTQTQHIAYHCMDLNRNEVTFVIQCQEVHTIPVQKEVCWSWLMHQGLGYELQPISSQRSSMKTLLSITLR